MKRWYIEINQDEDSFRYLKYLEELEANLYNGKLEVAYRDPSSGVFIIMCDDDVAKFFELDASVKRIYLQYLEPESK